MTHSLMARPWRGHTESVRTPSHRTLARFTDLSIYGSYYVYATVIWLVGAALGGLLGRALTRDPAIGIALGGLAGMLAWMALVVWARRVLGKYEGRRRAEP